MKWMKTKSLNQPSRSSVSGLFTPSDSRTGMQQLQDIDEVNMFKDDNTVIHMKKPQSKYF